MKRLLPLLFLFAPAAFGQSSPGASYQWGGNITAANSACVIKACVGIQLPSPIASTISVGVTGTWSATLAVEESQDGGRTWTSAGASLTSNGTTTYTITAFTNFRVRASAFVSGNAGVNLQVGASGSGGGGGSGTPGGADTDIQFNDAGAFGGDANLTWDKTTGSFSANGGANSSSGITAGTSNLNAVGAEGNSSGNNAQLVALEPNADDLIEADRDISIRPNVNGSTSGKLKIGLATGNSGQAEFEGKTSGSAEIGVADAAGTPNRINLPTTTCTNGQVWQTDGGNPQQLSCLTPSSGITSAPNQVNFYASPNCNGQPNCVTLSTTVDNATNFSTLFAASNAAVTTTNPIDPRTTPQAAAGHTVTSQVVTVTNYPGDTIFVFIQDNNLLGATPISDGLNTYTNVIPATTLGGAGTLSLWKATGTSVINSLTVTATGSDNLVVSVLVLPGVSGQVVGTTSSSGSSNTVSISQTTTQAGSMVIAGCSWYNGGVANLTSTAGTLRLNQAGSVALAGQGLWGTYRSTVGAVTNSGTLSGAASATGCISAEIKGGGTTQGNPVIDIARGYYYFSANFNPTIPTTIHCEPGAFLHYIGTNDFMDFGPIGGLAAGQGVIFPPYILQGCTLAGGALMAKGVVMQPNIAAVQILDNNFLDAGNASQPIIYGTCENWDILISRNRFISDDFTGRPIFSNNNGPFNSGNCPVTIDENSFLRLLDNVGYIMPGRGQSASSSGASVAQSAIGFTIDTAHAIITGNNFAFYNPVLKLRCSNANFASTGAGCAGVNITSNLLEPPSSGTTNRVPVIQYSTGFDQLQIEHNEVFLANLAGDALLGPISGTDLLTNVRIITNQVGRLPSASPLVVLNNLAGNTGNQAAGNAVSVGGNIGPNTSGFLLHTAGASIPQWSFIADESLGTGFNCAVSSASPAACLAAAAGTVAVPTAATTYTVNTTAVTANSQIVIQQDTSATAGTRLGVTCNATVSTALPLLTAKVAGTSFTFSLTAPAVNPACFSYMIIN